MRKQFHEFVAQELSHDVQQQTANSQQEADSGKEKC